MNNYIPSGTSLFDVLSMIIPGGLIIAFIADISGLMIENEALTDYTILSCGIIIIMSYLVGLIWSSFMDLLFIQFRIDKHAILYTKKSLNKAESKTFFLLFLLTQRNIIKNYPNIKELYISAYYKVIKTPISRVIMILETQVAFIRNIILITLSYGIYILESNRFIAGLFKCHSKNVIGWSLIIVSILLFFIMLYRQNKIYYLIWEGEYHNSFSS